MVFSRYVRVDAVARYIAPGQVNVEPIIQAAINGLQADGDTNGEDALKIAHNEANKSLKDAVSSVS